MASDSSKLAAAMQVIGEHLDEIRREVFKPDTKMKLTFIARDPGNPEADVVVSEDDLAGVAELVARSLKREIVVTPRA